ncbi:ParB/RepB/Spo0J family partition protein [Streptacidiphilus sp. EB129]|uniref:ParB/RepB/Spo0J family partition protein n=1 Tax=Streptacidiphilus sp. EB129 TaxID=3156262 RepID=UPI00351376C2
MSITATEQTQPAPAVEGDPGTTMRSVGRLEYLDPRVLVIDPFNHRKSREGQEVRPDAALIASVEAVGVDTPITVRPQADGQTLGAVKGQRRLMAAVIAAEKAVKAGKPIVLIPALVREDLAGVDDEALVLSMIENTHRQAASRRDDMDALTQLALMPMTATKRKKHAKTLGYKAAEIEAANQAAQLDDEALADAMDADFDIVEMAEWQSVGGDDSDLWDLKQAKAKDRSEGKGRRGHWNHAIARLRQELQEQAEHDRVEAELRAAGTAVTEKRWNWGQTTERPLSDLVNALGRTITAERHAEMCTAHGAYIDRDNTPVYVCTDWRKAGHQLSEAAAKADGGRGGSEKLDAAAKGRRTRTYKPLWLAAREVRKDFITELVARKETTKATWDQVLTVTVATPHWYTDGLAKHETKDLSRFLKMKDPKLSAYRHTERTKAFAQVIARTPAARRGNVLFAQLAAAAELVTMHDRAWDAPDTEVVAWLEFLASEGYTLSEVETEVIATAKESTAKRSALMAPTPAAPEQQDDQDEADGQQQDQADGEQPADAHEDDAAPVAEAADEGQWDHHGDAHEQPAPAEGEGVGSDGQE